MKKFRALLARAFDVRALVLLRPVYFFIALDVTLTLLGQSSEYWKHFFSSGFSADTLTLLTQHESFWRRVTVSGNEIALFGFGAYLLSTHPLFFFGGCTVYMVVAGVVILFRIPGRIRLIAFQAFSLAHAFAAFGWMEGTVKYVFRNIPDDFATPQMWVWLIGIVYTYLVARYLECTREKYYTRMNQAKDVGVFPER